MPEKKSGRRWFWSQFCGRSSSSNFFSSESASSSSDSDTIQNQEFASSSNDSDSIQNQDFRYDVFLSFRGPDTRNSFVAHLHSHLLRKGIFVFKDDHKLRMGESISLQLPQAIKGSRISIIVFSQDYPSSSWCLEEMATIADCQQQSNQTVFPVFYDVDPSHVRHQNGVYEKAFVSLRQKFKRDPDKVCCWEKAMNGFGKLAGWDVRNKSESEVIEDIVEKVIKKLDHKFSGFVDDVIGIQPRVQALEDKLRLSSKSDDVKVLGIWGMNGIGKTTHATVLYDKISHRFDASCFIEDVSKLYRDGGHTAVQREIIYQTLLENSLHMSNPIKISGIVKNRLHNMKLLIVLDNVDELEQLEKLAIKPKLLLKGSRMVITTTDEHILKVYEGGVLIHKVSLLNDNDARELFCRKAFKSEEQSSSCAALIPEILKYAQGLPLAIRVLGSFLCTRDAVEWRDALNRLENNPDDKIMNVLQISFDGLQHQEKQIFLHIACFFKGEREDYVKRILECFELHPHIGISRLIDKSLISIRDQEILMHEMIQELGKKIVRDQSPEEPGSRSRIWLYKDFFDVLTRGTGTEKVKAIVLNKKEEISECRVDALSKMKELTLLMLYHTEVSGSLEFLSDRLRYLLWHDYPFTSLPPYFTASNLVELNMPNSHVKRLWEDRKSCPNLKRIDLSNSMHLIETPDFSRIINLERLDLSGCRSLSHVHSSIGLLKKLAFLNLRNCSNLVIIDFGRVGNMSSLRVLYLSACTKLESTPDFTRATHLEYLDMDKCESLSIIHESIGVLSNLTFLSLRYCRKLVSIPNDINFLVSLQTLDLCGCFKLTDQLPRQASASHLKSLISLDLGSCNLEKVPDAIGELRCLERLNLLGNGRLVSIPDSFRELHCLAYLNLSHCYKLEALLDLPMSGATSGGRYFKTVSGSRDRRSGLYLFNCDEMADIVSKPWDCWSLELTWLFRLIKESYHFRGGFDIVVPWSLEIPRWFIKRFEGDKVTRIVEFNVDEDWMGFAFGVIFQANNDPMVGDATVLDYSSHPFYLSFASKHTEEYFNFPHNLKKQYPSGTHLWIIYISREHCHFVNTGAHITFKAWSDLKINAWGMRSIFRKDVHDFKRMQQGQPLPFPRNEVHPVNYDDVEKNNTNSNPTLRLPYNWLLTKEDEAEKNDAQVKENNLSYAGF